MHNTTLPSPHSGHSLIAAMSSDPELKLVVYSAVAREGKLASAGITQKEAADLICSATLGGKGALADLFAESCIHYNEYDAAVIDGYERARSAGSLHQFSPGFDILARSRISPQFARSPSIRPSPGSFWRHFTSSIGDWADDASLRALEIRTQETIESQRIPGPAIAKALAASPCILAAMMQGAALSGSWDAAECLLEQLSDRLPLDYDMAALLPALSLLCSAHPSFDILSTIGRLSLLCTTAASRLAAEAGSVLIDFIDLEGSLLQPDGTGLSSCLRWLPRHPARLEDSFPSISLSVGEIVAHWQSPEGQAVAREAGFSTTPRSEAIFAALKRIGSATGAGERRALLDALALIDCSPRVEHSARAPRL